MCMVHKIVLFKCVVASSLLTSILSQQINHWNHTEPLENDNIITLVNQSPALWKAGRNFHNSVKKHHIHCLMGLRSISKSTILRSKKNFETVITNEAIPNDFDARGKWPFCKNLQTLTDQGNCGSCWAVSSSSALSDRMCIASNGKFNQILSIEELISCCTSCGEGCFGGYDDHAWMFMQNEGLVTGGGFNSKEGCQPYSIKPCEHTPEGPLPHCSELGKVTTPYCKRKCFNELYKTPYDQDHHKAKEIYYVDKIQDMQRDIMTHGPAQTGFMVYEDFMSYKSGVYHHIYGKEIGLHAVKVIGWGIEKNVPYWLVQNSWNKYWGDHGYFKIIRGENECGFESRMYGAFPSVYEY